MFEITVHNWVVFPSFMGSSVLKILKLKAYLKAKGTPLNKLLSKQFVLLSIVNLVY